MFFCGVAQRHIAFLSLEQDCKLYSSLQHFPFPDFSFKHELLLICEVIVQKTSEGKSILHLSLPFVEATQSTESMKVSLGKRNVALSWVASDALALLRRQLCVQSGVLTMKICSSGVRGGKKQFKAKTDKMFSCVFSRNAFKDVVGKGLLFSSCAAQQPQASCF